MGTDSESFWKSTEDSCIFVKKLSNYLIKQVFKIMLIIQLKRVMKKYTYIIFVTMSVMP